MVSQLSYAIDFNIHLKSWTVLFALLPICGRSESRNSTANNQKKNTKREYWLHSSSYALVGQKPH